ncbi:MAG: toll/interleukin-1 receptor domain-containing protein [Spirochaetes bacterium]|uniref:Toll/interleukin-1 receptor domain-containing protein n=1 Tax=Candidatus Avitreponema avistercoris TaxID=2840705 RepID=A0A9D9HGL7_9SPIR|nr:toll/interleukin-1 receptor domain-containing protein [Candidatus Avitreponema avistercoris]
MTDITEKLTEEEIRQIVKNTQIVLSFGSANGGFDIASEAYSIIKTRYEGQNLYTLYSVDDALVYFDAKTLKGKKGTKIEDGKVLNDQWKEIYLEAIRNANAMLFIITDAWLKSKWCWQEFGWYLEKKNDTSGRKKPLNVRFLLEKNARNRLANNKEVTDNTGKSHALDQLNQTIITTNKKGIDHEFDLTGKDKKPDFKSVLISAIQGCVFGEKNP